MLYYYRIDVFREIDVNKINESRKRIICNNYYFLKINICFQPKSCDGCHDIMQKAMSLMKSQFF